MKTWLLIGLLGLAGLGRASTITISSVTINGNGTINVFANADFAPALDSYGFSFGLSSGVYSCVRTDIAGAFIDLGGGAYELASLNLPGLCSFTSGDTLFMTVQFFDPGGRLNVTSDEFSFDYLVPTPTITPTITQTSTLTPSPTKTSTPTPTMTTTPVPLIGPLQLSVLATDWDSFDGAGDGLVYLRWKRGIGDGSFHYTVYRDSVTVTAVPFDTIIPDNVAKIRDQPKNTLLNYTVKLTDSRGRVSAASNQVSCRICVPVRCPISPTPTPGP